MDRNFIINVYREKIYAKNKRMNVKTICTPKKICFEFRTNLNLLKSQHIRFTFIAQIFIAPNPKKKSTLLEDILISNIFVWVSENL